MCKKDFKFNPCWNGNDDIPFYINVKVLPDYKMWQHTEIAQELVNKMEVPSKGKFICDIFGNPAEYIRDENGEYIWGEGIEEDNPVKNKSRETRRDAAKTAKIRKSAIATARKTNARKANANGRVIILKNPRGLFIRDLANKANPGDERDRKRNRRAGKKCSNYYELPKREIPETPDIPADELGGYWDVGKQEFISDNKMKLLAKLISKVNEMEFPAIITAEVNYNIQWGVNCSFHSLGLIESVEEAKAAVTRLVNYEYSDLDEDEEDEDERYITVKAHPIKGNHLIGGAFYCE